MASPQCEQGFTRLSNEFFDALLLFSTKITKREYAIMLAVVRQTWGYNRTESFISCRLLETLTGIQFPKCHATLHDLSIKKMVLIKKIGRRNLCSPVKDYSTWSGWDADKSLVLESRYSFSSLENNGDKNVFSTLENNGVPTLENNGVPTLENNGVLQNGNYKRQPKDILKTTTGRFDFLGFWDDCFGCPLPDALFEKAVLMMQEIKAGTIDPTNIRFPIPYLNKWMPKKKNGHKLPASVMGVVLKEGQVIIWDGIEHTLSEGGCLRSNGGCTPQTALLQGLADGIIQLKNVV